MITYEVRNSNPAEASFKRILINLKDRESWNPRSDSVTLWQVERESEAEAAVRRMNWLGKFWHQVELATGESLASMVDRLCPPPAPSETQLDWDTGDPIETHEEREMKPGLWISTTFKQMNGVIFGPSFQDSIALSQGLAATGPNKDAAYANLRAIRASLKSQPK